MKQLIKQKISKILIIIIAIAIIFSLDINIKQVKAATLNSKEYYDLYSTQGMIMKEGCLIIPSKGKTASSNYRYRAIGYNLTITKNGVSTTKYMSKSTYDKGPGNLTSGRYTYKTTIFTKEDIESVFGIDLDTGSISIVSNARMEAYNASTGEVYITNLNSWSDWTSLNKWPGDAICDALEPYRTEFYNKTVYWENYKLTVNKGTGIASTSGSGWYKPNTSISYKGTAANGYNSPTSGSIKMPYNNKTVTVSATPNKLTIKFKMNGGNIGGSTADKTQTMSYGTHYKVTYTPSRTGYNFKGWGKSGSNTIYIYPSSATSGVKINTKYAAKGWGDHLGASISAHSNNSVTLEAKWTAKKYTVSYNSNKPTSASTIPTGSMSNQTATYNNNFKTNKNKFALVGYEFTGWNEKANNQGTAWNKNTTGTYENGTAWKWTYTKNITLYAQWKAKNYTITFHPNEGYFSGNSTNVTKSQTVTFDSTSNNSFTTIPLRTGYTFKGWHTSKTGGTQVYYSNGNCIAGTSYWNSSKKWIYANNLTVYAHWTPNTYDLTIDPNGGTMYNGDNTTTSSFTTKFVYDRKTYIGNLTSDGNFYPDNTPWRTGYTFTGYTFSNGSGGLNTAGNKFYFSNTNNYASSIESYIFNGDYAGNVTVTSQWTPNIYTITLDNQGATTAGTTAYYEKYNTGNYTTSGCTTTISSITIPKKTGYTFNGYYTATSGGVQYINASGKINSITTSFVANTTLYAQWSINTYKLNINPNGGTWENKTSIQSFTQNYETTKKIANPIRTGYTFNGWTGTGNAGSLNGTTFTFGKKSNGVVYANGGEGTLTASWTANTYKVTFNPNEGNFSDKSKNETKEITVTYNNTTGNVAEIPLRTGYTFTGWYTKKTNGTKVYDSKGNTVISNYWNSNKKWVHTNNLTVYAQWNVNSYTVNCIDIIKNTNIILGQNTFEANYGTTVSGTTMGTDKTTGAYYTDYKYDSAKSATVQVSNTTVYRYFILDNFNLTATAKPNTNSNKGSIALDWSTISGKNKIFKGYQSKDNGTTWQSISLSDYSATNVIDYSAMDTNKPTKPVITISGINCNISATDTGTKYLHKIEVYHKEDQDTLLNTSNVTTATVTTNIKEYRYIFNNNANTILTATSGTAVNTTTAKVLLTSNTAKYKYLHVVAVDKAGNVSDTTTVNVLRTVTVNHVQLNVNNEYITDDEGDFNVEIETETYPVVLNTSFSPEVKEYEGFEIPAVKTVTVNEDMTVEYIYERISYKNVYEHILKDINYKFLTSYHEMLYGKGYAINTTYATNCPNGITLKNTFDSDYTGTMETYSLGAIIYQPSRVITNKIYYEAIPYYISYELDGGTNNELNPETYNILTTVELLAPSKVGHNFIGWYEDAEFTKPIEKINANINNNFTSAENMFSELNKREVKDITIYAKFELCEYEITTNVITGVGVTSDISKVEYGTNTAIVISAGDGQQITKITVDGQEINFDPDAKTIIHPFYYVDKDYIVNVEMVSTAQWSSDLDMYHKYEWVELKLN